MVYDKFQSDYYENSNQNLPELPNCSKISYDLINCNMLLVDLFAPRKFIDSEISYEMKEDDEDDDERPKDKDDEE